MDQHTGTLTDISPWGTGFIEDTAGCLFGFHRSMLRVSDELAVEDWSKELNQNRVTFEVKDGIASNVVIQKSASNAKAGG